MPEEDNFYKEITPKPYKKNEGAKVVAKKAPPSSSRTDAKSKKTWGYKSNFQIGRHSKIYFFIIILVLVFTSSVSFINKVSIVVHPKDASLIALDSSFFSIGDGYYAFPGTYRVALSASGYYAKTFQFDVTGDSGNQFVFELEKQPGNLEVLVIPQVDATIKIDSVLKGEVPGRIDGIFAGEHTIEVQAEGYETMNSTVIVTGMGKTQTFTAQLIKEMTPTLNLISSPEGAAVNINNQFVGLAPLRHPLEPNKEYNLLVVKPGYKPTKKIFQLKPKEQKKIEIVLQPKQGKPVKQKKSRNLIESELGLEFAVFKPSKEEVTYDKGRIPYTALLSRSFAISKTETTNKQFRMFIPSHSSGQFKDKSLDDDDKPVVNVSWSQAALFSNWLSEQAGINPFYIVQNGKVISFNPVSIGYRLVSEAEWVSILQGLNQYIYFWGNDLNKVSDKSGNYADISAANILANTLEYYNDGHPISSEVRKFYPDKYGIYDMGGNVAEWLHDVFTINPYKEHINPLGPGKGANHLIRGGSWKYSSSRMLSTSYRQYHIDQGKPEVGFRLAYYLR